MATKSTKINAGVLLIELNCDNGAGRHENAFLMLQSGASVPKQQQNYRKRKQDLVRTYSDGGGKQEPDDLDSTYTAAREMREESAGLIAIPPQNNSALDRGTVFSRHTECAGYNRQNHELSFCYTGTWRYGRIQVYWRWACRTRADSPTPKPNPCAA